MSGSRLTVALLSLLSLPLTLAAADDHITPLPADEVTFKDVKSVFKLVDIHKAFKEHNKILIGNYRVAYSVARSAYAREEGRSETEQIGSGGWKTVRNYKDQELRATVELQGVDSSDLKAMTQKAYLDLKQRLKAVGRDVVTMDQIGDSAVIANKLERADVDENGEYWTNFGIGEARELTIVTWPENTPLWFMMGDVLDAGASYKAAFNALKMKNFGFIKEISGEQEAGLLDVSVTIRFASAWSQRAKTLRRAKVGVEPGMTMTLNKVGLSTSRVSKMGVFPGPSGQIQGFKKARGYKIGNDWADYSKDISSREGWSATGETIELVVTTDPVRMEAAVLEALTSLNAVIASIAKQYPAK